MSKDNLDECIGSLFSAMMAEERKESKRLVGEVIEKLKETNHDLEDPEHFDLFINTKLNMGIREIAKSFCDTPSEDVEDKNKPNFIYTRYRFLENHVRQLVISRTGSSCCADKSRHVLAMYLNYALTGKVPDFDPTVEHYWLPKFGTNQEWIDLCDGIYHLYYGQPEKYLLAYKVLIETEIRQYKHTLHKWFIEFQDGEVIQFDSTWDERDENPMERGVRNKEEFYVMYKKHVKHRGYEPYADETYPKHYFKVPKSDVKNIYKTSEEVMV